MGNADGKVIIKSILDSELLEKQLEEQKKELKNYQKEADELLKQRKTTEMQVGIDTKKVEEDLRKIEEKINQFKEKKEYIEKFEPWRLEGASYAIATEELQKQTDLYNIKKKNLETINQIFGEIDKKIEKNKENQKLLNNEIQKTESQIKKTKSIENILNNINKGTEKTINKISKWALAIFGIRSAYMLVRNAMSTLTQYDEQLKADIEYMKNALAYTLEPIVRAIVNLMKQLMFYVAYIIKAWTGKNIFQNANKSLASANKQATKLSKTLAGFDEMNILSNNAGGDGGGGTLPSFDLTKPEDMEVPKWLQWIVVHKDEVIAGLFGIAGGLSAVAFGASLLKGLGLGLFITGIVYAIQGLIQYLNDPSWSNFGQIIQGIGMAIIGLGLLFENLPLIIAGAIVLILGTIAKFWDEIEKFLDKLIDKIFSVGNKIMDWINEKLGIFGVLINTVIGTVIGVITEAINLVKSLLGGVFKFLRSILDSIILVFKGDFKGALSTILKGIGNLFIDVLNAVISALNLITSPVRSLIVALGKVAGKSWTMENIRIPKIPRLAKGGIVNMPGRGVPVGGALAGEKSQEGVIPLTDSQQMELLGESIGKYITVNLTNVTELDGRTIARRVQEVNNNTNFLLNR